MFLCLFIDFSLAEQMRQFKKLSEKKTIYRVSQRDQYIFIHQINIRNWFSYCADAELKIALNEVLD